MKSNTSLVVLLVIIIANCIARSIKYELNSKQRFNPLMQKTQTNNGSCEPAVSLFQICGNKMEGIITDVDTLITDCDGGLGFVADFNVLDTNSTVHSYRLNSTALLICWTLEQANANITGDIYINDNIINGTGTMCDNVAGCINMSFSGVYESIHNDPCYDVAFEGEVCHQ